MKVKNEKNLFESVNNYRSWWYKIYSFLKWDISNFIINVYNFRKELYNYKWWDYEFTLQMLSKSITLMENGMIKYDNPKADEIRKVSFLLKNKINDNYITLAEKELGHKFIFRGLKFEESDKKLANGEKLFKLVNNLTIEQIIINQKITKRAKEIEEEQWGEIWDLIKGNNLEKKDFIDSGMRSWWC